MSSILLIINEFSDESCPATRLAYDFGRNMAATSEFRIIQVNLRTKYRPGGTNPVRVLSLVAMHLMLPFLLFFWRLRGLMKHTKVVQLVLTLPPLIHIAATWWGHLLGLKTVVWYQDAHPELEARILERHGHLLSARFIRLLDHTWLRLADGIIALDQAMADLLCSISPVKNIKISPPWITYVSPPKALRAPSQDSPLKILYAGNYGFAHDLQPLTSFLAQLDNASKAMIKITATGMSETSRAGFSEMFSRAGVEVQTIPRMASFQDLCAMMDHFDFGLVSLNETYAGLACPSKAFTYISQGLPVLYIGPSKTLPDSLTKEGWGISLEQLKAAFSPPESIKSKVTAPLSKIGQTLPSPAISGLSTVRGVIESVVS
jgi:hypothetical protein